MCAVRKVPAEPEHGDVSQLSLRTRTRTLLHFSERHREPAGSIPAAETHTWTLLSLMVLNTPHCVSVGSLFNVVTCQSAQHCRCKQVLKHSEKVFYFKLVKTKHEIHSTCLNEKHVDYNTETLWQALCAVCSQQVHSVRRLVNTSLVSPVDVIQSRHSHLINLLSALC